MYFSHDFLIKRNPIKAKRQIKSFSSHFFKERSISFFPNRAHFRGGITIPEKNFLKHFKKILLDDLRLQMKQKKNSRTTTSGGKVQGS